MRAFLQRQGLSAEKGEGNASVHDKSTSRNFLHPKPQTLDPKLFESRVGTKEIR